METEKVKKSGKKRNWEKNLNNRESQSSSDEHSSHDSRFKKRRISVDMTHSDSTSSVESAIEEDGKNGFKPGLTGSAAYPMRSVLASPRSSTFPRWFLVEHNRHYMNVLGSTRSRCKPFDLSCTSHIERGSLANWEPQPSERQSPTGGIFDDADDVPLEYSSKVAFPQVTKQSPKEGVFDDAEDDVSIEFPGYDGESGLVAQAHIQNKCVVNKVVPTNATKPSKSQDTQTEREREVDASKKQTNKRKLNYKPTKRFLFAKKEKDIAKTLLSKIDDLSEVLPSNDCHFLAEKLWIFTVQQLEHVLGSTNRNATETERCVDGTDLSLNSGLKESEENLDSRRRRLLVLVASSGSVMRLGGVKENRPYQEQKCSSAETGRRDDSHGHENTELKFNEGKEISPREKTVSVSEQPLELYSTHTVTEQITGSIEDNAMDAAEVVLQSWQAAITEHKALKVGKPNISLPDEWFLLEGPLSCLFPISTRNFLASVPIKSLYEFLSLKKTETGAIVSLYAAWRRKCGLTEANALALARHLVGLSSRATAAVSSIPAADKITRKWMGDPIVVLTGAAREFLIEERGMVTALQFLATRTKDVAVHLVEWRDRKGLPPLRGSGKVAMVSGWKASVKEAMDIEEGEGQVLKSVDLVALMKFELPIVRDERVQTTDTQSSDSNVDSRTLDDDAALNSSDFLLEVLGHDSFAVLSSAGVKCAVDLFAADKKEGSVLLSEISKTLGNPSNATTCEKILFDWCQIVRKKLSGLRKVRVPKKGASKLEANGKNLDAKQMSSKNGNPSSPQKIKDPFDALSAITKSFLGSRGITDAEQFLCTRTTDTANAFIEWRSKNNMAPLKGLGAIASVSGWKASVRKAAKDIGLDDLAKTVPTGGNAAMDVAVPLKPNIVEKPKVRDRPRIKLLFGKQRRHFVVQSSKDATRQYAFELSVRKSESSPGLFVSYKGTRRLQPREDAMATHDVTRVTLLKDLGKAGVLPVTYPVLCDVWKDSNKGSEVKETNNSQNDAREPFSTFLPGCGLVDLSKHGVYPLPSSGEIDVFFEEVMAFISARDYSIPDDSRTKSASSERVISKVTLFDEIQPGKITCRNQGQPPCNVLVWKNKDGQHRYFLYLPKPLEEGQTVELQFLSSLTSSHLEKGMLTDLQWRRHIEEIAVRLPGHRLRHLLDSINRKIVHSVENKLNYFLDRSIINLANFSDRGSQSRDGVSGMGSQLDDDNVSDSDSADLCKLFVARRRVSWVLMKISAYLEQTRCVENKGDCVQGLPLQGEKSAIIEELVFRWNPKVLQKWRMLPKWTSSLVQVMCEEEIRKEILAEVESNKFVNSYCREQWSALAKNLFDKVVKSLAHFCTAMGESHSLDRLTTDLLDFLEDAVRTVQQPGTSKDLFTMTLTVPPSGNTDIFPSPCDVFQTAVVQAYHDSLCLCDEIPYCVSPPEKLAVQPTLFHSEYSGSEQEDKIEAEQIGHRLCVMRTEEDISRHRLLLHRGWIVNNQVMSILHVLRSCNHMMKGIDSSLDVDLIIAELYGQLKNKFNDKHLFPNDVFAMDRSQQLVSWIPKQPTCDTLGYQPRSLQLFLALVWPFLRSFGWKLEAGSRPNEMIFSQPGQGRNSSDSHTKILKQERARTRTKVAKAANDLGLGYVPKLTKRLLIMTGAAFDKNKIKFKCSAREESPLNSVLEQFLFHIKESLPNGDVESFKRAERVVGQVKVCFDELAPYLFCRDDKRSTSSRERNKSCKEVYGCVQLAQLLLVLPSILRQSNLSHRQIEDTKVVVRELADFLAINHKEFFDECFHPSREQYVQDNKVQSETVASLLAAKRRKIRGKTKTGQSGNGVDATCAHELKEAVLPEDRPDVTDFIYIVMSQVLPCRATAEDVAKKNRKIQVGFPGLLCRHCFGVTEGRYFFTSMESLTTAATVIEKHMAKCTEAPPAIKTEIVRSRARHQEQRRNAPSGSQSSFFGRLWDRMQSLKDSDLETTIATSTSYEVLVPPAVINSNKKDRSQNKERKPRGSEVSNCELEFDSHLWLMDYLPKTAPWCEKPELMDAIRQYYKCLEFGGKVYKTEAMPSNFNTEWILSKLECGVQLEN